MYLKIFDICIALCYLKHVVHHICVFEAIFSPDKKNICMKTHNPLYLTSIFHRWPSSGNQNKTMWSLPYCSYHSSGQSIPESKIHVFINKFFNHCRFISYLRKVPTGKWSVCWHVWIRVGRIVLEYWVGIISIVISLTEICNI